MKGFVKTLEAAIGTLILLGIVTTMAGELDVERAPAEVSSLNDQLQNIDRTVIENAVETRNISLIEQNLDTVTLEIDTSIVVWDNSYHSSSDTSFSKDFNYNENSSNVELLVWGDSQTVSVDLNGEEQFNGALSFERIPLQPSAGTNSLEFSNPSGSRTSYLLKHEKRFGDNVPDSENVYVIRRIFKQDPAKNSEVNIYLWD